jgi:hypothetical protein
MFRARDKDLPLTANAGKAAASIMGFFVAASVASPYFLLTPKKVLSDINEALFQAGRAGFEGWEIDPSGGYTYLAKSLETGMGLPLLIACLLGLVLVVWQRSTSGLLVAIVPVATYVFLGNQEMYFARFMLPAYPGLIVLGAGATIWVLDSKKIQARYPWSLILIALTTLPSTRSVLRHNHLLAREDTRTEAKQWIEANVPAMSKIALDREVFSPPLSTRDDPQPRSRRSYNVILVGDKGLSMRSLDEYRLEEVEFVVTSSHLSRISLSDPVSDASRRTFYSNLDEELELVAQFRPFPGPEEPAFVFDQIYGPWTSLSQVDRPGPEIRVYRLSGSD